MFWSGCEVSDSTYLLFVLVLSGSFADFLGLNKSSEGLHINCGSSVGWNIG